MKLYEIQYWCEHLWNATLNHWGVAFIDAESEQAAREIFNAEHSNNYHIIAVNLTFGGEKAC